MKKLIVIILSLFMVVLTACNKSANLTVEQKPTDTQNQTQTKTESESKQYVINDFFPMKGNLRMKYAGSGNEYASKDVYVDYLRDNKVQLRIITGGTTGGQILENKNGELKTVFSRGEFYYRDDLTKENSNTNDILIKEPIVKGNTWTLSDGRKRTITAVGDFITTPAGKFKSIEVTTEGKDSTTKDYYGLGIGLIKTVFQSNGLLVTTTLEKLDKDAAVTQTVKFYYPMPEDSKIGKKKIVASFKTNDETKSFFEKNFKKAPNSSTIPLMTANTKINKLYLNEAEKKVYVDFSKEFVSQMNAGTYKEQAVLTSVTDTLGNYYNVDKVYITIEGKPYASGHIIKKAGEVFKVNYENIVSLD
ncbi:GerMN domain-containing protein [Clostridium aciditolerans]|uniref:GerMN domain-containing protein n=1 Tax=Clostridium aciditolerans TaxID=339861 RepID=A0A934M6Q7_9CLOT|nr:GerMN domain-containing protein [Clostridium aciditolerans]MBI6874858.1 GerMN domain-containing protein [Clostridium aciditolerans]